MKNNSNKATAHIPVIVLHNAFDWFIDIHEQGTPHLAYSIANPLLSYYNKAVSASSLIRGVRRGKNDMKDIDYIIYRFESAIEDAISYQSQGKQFTATETKTLMRLYGQVPAVLNLMSRYGTSKTKITLSEQDTELLVSALGSITYPKATEGSIWCLFEKVKVNSIVGRYLELTEEVRGLAIDRDVAFHLLTEHTLRDFFKSVCETVD